jgi:disulfide bond formation protein DsbB
MTECPCNLCVKYRVYTSYALIGAIAFAVGMTAAAWLERLGI